MSQVPPPDEVVSELKVLNAQTQTLLTCVNRVLEQLDQLIKIDLDILISQNKLNDLEEATREAAKR